MNRQQILNRIETAWAAFTESYSDLPEADLTMPGVVEGWSVRDILAHVTTWEEEALKYLPLIATGGTPPKYSVQYGGLDAFNALRTEQKRILSLSEALRQLSDTHRRLLDYVESVPEALFTRETPFRHRLRLDTYSHYSTHARHIREWRRMREQGASAQDPY